MRTMGLFVRTRDNPPCSTLDSWILHRSIIFCVKQENRSAGGRFALVLSCVLMSDNPVRAIRPVSSARQRLYSSRWTVPPMPRPRITNEHLDYIAALLDDMWRIPGTKIRFGLDALVGWIPGIGDSLAAIASCLIVLVSWRRGVPSITLVRMVANILLETTVGAIPVVGDVFHIAWKANRRNYRLLIREKQQPGSHTGRDWMFLAIIVFTAIAAVAFPVGMLIWLLRFHAR